MAPVDDVDEFRSLSRLGHLRSHSSEEDYAENINDLETEEAVVQDSVPERANVMETEEDSSSVEPSTSPFKMFRRELPNLEIPKKGLVFEGLENESRGFVQETAQEFVAESDLTIAKENFSDEDGDDSGIEIIPQESILKRINSHKEMKSYQLGKQLSCKWTTGAGPRIGCVRDYPCELQFRALEQVNLSPRSGSRTKSAFAPRSTTGLASSASTLAILYGDTKTEPQLENQSMFQRGDFSSRSEFSPLIRGSSVIPVIHMA